MLSSQKDNSGFSAQKGFVAIAVLYLLYAALYIYRTSFQVNGVTYFSLLDDGMISMRYARNLAEGFGLVFNPGGDRIEGYSNPLWVLYMAALHFLPINSSKISLLAQISGAILGLMNLFVIKKIADLLFDNRTLLSLSAVVLTAFYLPLNTWNFQGMEVSLLALLVSTATLITIRSARSQTFDTRLFLILGVASLVRMDVLIPTMIIVGYLLINVKQMRRRILICGLPIIAAFFAAQELFRFTYYGEWLPNTYYLKMTGYPWQFRIARGAQVLAEFVGRTWIVPFLLPIALTLKKGGRELKLLLVLFGGQLFYSVYVGGDVWDWWGGANRFISLTIPLFFVTVPFALQEMLRYLRRYVSWTLKTPIFVILVGVLLLSFNSIRGFSSLNDLFLLNPPLHVIDNKHMIERANLVRALTTPEATIAVTWAGAIPYFAKRTTIDLLGKNDSTIARQKAIGRPDWSSFDRFLPGHMKRDYSYSIGQLRPDFIVQLYGSATEAGQWLRDDYKVVRLGPFMVSLLNGSPNIRWDRLSEFTFRD